MATTGASQKVDPITFRDLVVKLRQYDRVLPTAEFDQLVAAFGWRATPNDSGKEPYFSDVGACIHAPWNFGGYEVQALFTPEGIRWITIRLTTMLYPPTPISTLCTQDAFAEYAAIALEVLGPPSRVETGGCQEIRWRGQTATVALVATRSRVSIDLALNDYYDDWDNSAEIES